MHIHQAHFLADAETGVYLEIPCGWNGTCKPADPSCGHGRYNTVIKGMSTSTAIFSITKTRALLAKILFEWRVGSPEGSFAETTVALPDIKSQSSKQMRQFDDA